MRSYLRSRASHCDSNDELNRLHRSILRLVKIVLDNRGLKPISLSIYAAVSPFKQHSRLNLLVQMGLGFIDLLECY